MPAPSSVPEPPRTTRPDLDAQLAPILARGGEAVEISARCHPEAHVDVGYWDGCMHLRCAACYQMIMRIAVAED